MIHQSFSFDIRTVTVSSKTLVLKALEQLLESSAVSKLPSQDLAAAVLHDRARPNASNARELVLYKDLQKGRLDSLRKRNGRAWFVSGVIASFGAHSDGYNSILDSFREGFAMRDELELAMEPCMEQEILHRIHFLLSVLRHSHNSEDFETLSAAAENR